MKMDLNSDLGESFGAWRMGDDASMLDIVSSANVACGFHAGDAAGILSTLKAAKARNVVVGAHVAYRDLSGFGRRNMDVASGDLVADVIYQIGALQGLAQAAGTSVQYVKPHGALYNTIAQDKRQAMDVINAIKAIDPKLVLMGWQVPPDWLGPRCGPERGGRGLCRSRLYARGRPGLAPRARCRAARRKPDCPAHADPGARGRDRGRGRQPVRVRPTPSACIGDSPGAVAIAHNIRQRFEQEGVQITSFVETAP
jgi:UPF0271 protein